MTAAVCNAAAPEDRYTIGDHGVSGCYVVDRVLDERVTPSGLTWAAAHCEAQRLNREALAALNKPAEPAAPSCECADQLERLRIALNKIARHSDDAYARETADDALFAASRVRGETP